LARHDWYARRLVHEYFGVDYDIVWDVAANKAAVLETDIEAILNKETPLGDPT
jgi:uncharacterized protein with HEPN domain